MGNVTGNISLDEFRRAVQASGLQAELDEVDKLFMKLDLSQNGSLQLSEFKTGLARLQERVAR